MLKTMWLSSIMTLTFNWTLSTAFSPAIESPRTPAPLYFLFAVVMAVTIWRWTIIWKQRHAGPSAALTAPPLFDRRKAAPSHSAVYQFFHDTLQKRMPHWLLSHIPTGRS